MSSILALDAVGCRPGVGRSSRRTAVESLLSQDVTEAGAPQQAFLPLCWGRRRELPLGRASSLARVKIQGQHGGLLVAAHQQ